MKLKCFMVDLAALGMAIGGSGCEENSNPGAIIAIDDSNTVFPIAEEFKKPNNARATIKETTVKRYHYDSHKQFENHLANLVTPYNLAGRLKTLKSLTLYEYICEIWTKDPERFRLNPIYQMPRLNIYPLYIV